MDERRTNADHPELGIVNSGPQPVAGSKFILVNLELPALDVNRRRFAFIA